MSDFDTAEKSSTSMPIFDVKKIREDFPILKQKVNNHPLIYLDNAASSQKPIQVIKTIDDYYRHYHSNVHRGVHSLSEKATHEYEAARKKVKQFINASSDQEIIFVRGATEAINLVAHSYGRSQLKAGDEIIISEMEHHSNIVPWQIVCEQTGSTLKVIPMNDAGELDLNAYKNLLNEKTKMVAIIHVSNALGTINPIKEMIDLAHKHDAVVLVDGAQAAPHQAIDVQALDADFYTISGHKLFAPTGIGILYGKQELLDNMPPYQSGGEMIRRVSFKKTEYNVLPHKFEAGTPHIAGAIGLGAAIDYIERIGMDTIARYEHSLISYATEQAEKFPDLTIIGTAQNKSSILSFLLGDIHAHDIGTILDQYGIAVRTGHHCAMPVMEHFKVPATTRASFALYNTMDEIDALFVGLTKVKEVFL